MHFFPKNKRVDEWGKNIRETIALKWAYCKEFSSRHSTKCCPTHFLSDEVNSFKPKTSQNFFFFISQEPKFDKVVVPITTTTSFVQLKLQIDNVPSFWTFSQYVCKQCCKYSTLIAFLRLIPKQSLVWTCIPKWHETVHLLRGCYIVTCRYEVELLKLPHLQANSLGKNDIELHKYCSTS